jgi:flavin reductase (DIM6/NTAB) family NADH-FMN oxidoreductase RutF
MELAAKVVEIGNLSGRTTDTFKATGLTPVSAEVVAAPLVDKCFANLECKVADESLVDRYGLFVLEVVKAWVDPAQEKPKTIHHHGHGIFVVDGKTIKLKSKKP